MSGKNQSYIEVEICVGTFTYIGNKEFYLNLSFDSKIPKNRTTNTHLSHSSRHLCKYGIGLYVPNTLQNSTHVGRVNKKINLLESILVLVSSCRILLWILAILVAEILRDFFFFGIMCILHIRLFGWDLSHIAFCISFFIYTKAILHI